MTGKVVNLNKARKARGKRDARARADANAVKFGRTATQKAQDAQDRAREAAKLDAHHLDTPPQK